MIYIDYCVFSGTYGGSNYELHFLEYLKSINLSISETYIKRNGWFKTCINIFKSYFNIILSRKSSYDLLRFQFTKKICM